MLEKGGGCVGSGMASDAKLATWKGKLKCIDLLCERFVISLSTGLVIEKEGFVMQIGGLGGCVKFAGLEKRENVILYSHTKLPFTNVQLWFCS